MNRFYPQRFDLALLVVRVAFGLMMMVHGWQKLSNYSEVSQAFPDPFGLSSPVSLGLCIFAELVCSGLLVVGALTPLALVPLIVTMLVAIFIAHGSDPWKKKELATAYLAVYGALMFSGPGRYSLDHIFFLKKDSE